jgi:hypothetical protein
MRNDYYKKYMKYKKKNEENGGSLATAARLLVPGIKTIVRAITAATPQVLSVADNLHDAAVGNITQKIDK